MTARPTIAFVTTSLIVGGQERSLVDLAVGLNGDRFRTLAITTKMPGPLAADLRRAGIPVYSDLLRSRYDVRILPRLVRILKRERVDVVYTIGSGDKMFWGRLAARLAGVPIAIASIRKTRSADGTHSIEWLNRLLTPLTDCIIAVGAAQAAYLRECEGIPPRLLRVIHNGVPVARFPREPDAATALAARQALGLPADAPVIGIVAALRPEKAHEVFLEAARHTRTQHPTTHFLVIGDGPRRAELETLAEAQGLADCVHFLGTRADVAHVLPALDVICLSSHPLVETFPVSILEGMAAARPAVVTDVGSLREMVRHDETGLVVPADNPAALAEAWGWMIAHPAERRAMGRAGRQRFLERFTLAITLRTHEDLFDELLARGPRLARVPAGETVS